MPVEEKNIPTCPSCGGALTASQSAAIRNTTLKPCPFCGEDAEIVETKGRYVIRTVVILCTTPGCAGNNGVVSTDVGKAIAAWNTRTAEKRGKS